MGRDFTTDGIDLSLIDSLITETETGKTATIQRSEIETGKLYFKGSPAAIGQSAAIEFKVSDGEITSIESGLFEFKVVGAPKSANDAIRDEQFRAEYEVVIVAVII